MRGLLRGLAVVTLIAAVAVTGSVSSASSQAKPAAKKLDIAYLTAPPESGAIGLKFMAEEVTKRSNGAINMVFHGGTLLNKELEIMDAVKSGNVAIGCPSGAASTVFPEMGVFLTPYLVRDYQHAYAMFNGQIGKDLDETFQKKYKVKVLFFFDYGFRHFWNSKRPINTPADLKGLKMRVQQGKVFADTVNGLGASAVPMPWGEVIPAAQQGVIDGADLPVVNINALKVYEVSKFASMTYHNYGPTVVVMNLDIWKSLPAGPAEAHHGRGDGGAEEDARGHRERGQLRQGQGDPRGQGHEGEPGRRRLVPQAGRGEDLAPVQAAVRRDVGQDRQHQVGGGDPWRSSAPRSP